MMPVTFYVDPEIVADRDGKYVHTITLSYTFYQIDLPEGFAALETDSDTNLSGGTLHWPTLTTTTIIFSLRLHGHFMAHWRVSSCCLAVSFGCALTMAA
jgi:hypothetical protein